MIIKPNNVAYSQEYLSFRKEYLDALAPSA